MQEVICHQCRNSVNISPDSDHCPACGENLKAQLDPDFVSGYFYERARDTAASGNMIEALAEAERGLRQQKSTELYLLAAILAQKLERFDEMRNHVAAIPVDDPLRPEGEWLLRSHQEHQRAIREQIRSKRNFGARKSGAPEPATVGIPQAINRPMPVKITPARRRVLWPRLGAFLGVVAAIALSVLIWSPIARTPLSRWPINGFNAWMQDALLESAPTEQDSTRDENSVAAPTSRQGAATAPASTATATIATDLANATVSPEAVVDTDPRSSVSISAEEYGLARYLRAKGYPALAKLPVTARIREQMLILDGIVHMDAQRRQLLEIAYGISGVTTVHSVDLLLRPLPGYTVQDGDTLYSIVYDIYGDLRRVDEFYEYNRDLLPTRDQVPVGVELRVPPID